MHSRKEHISTKRNVIRRVMVLALLSCICFLGFSKTALAEEAKDADYAGSTKVKAYVIAASEDVPENDSDYINNLADPSKYYATTATLPTRGFQFVENTADPYSTVYEILDNDNLGLHSGSNQGYDVVCWYKGENPNVWMFKEVTVDQAVLKKQQEAFNEKHDLVTNSAKYAAAIAAARPHDPKVHRLLSLYCWSRIPIRMSCAVQRVFIF